MREAATTPTSPTPSKTTPTNRLIVKIKESGYRRFIAPADTEDGHLSQVHIADFLHPRLGECTAFVKLYPSENGHNRGLVNEITAHLFGHAVGVTQPRFAFVANIPLQRLGRLSGWLSDIAKTHATWPAFCAQRLEGKSAALRVPNTDMPSLIEDIRRWDELPKAVALDEGIANTDRHLNNLIRLGKRRFAVIDGGRLADPAGSEHWRPETLAADALYRNRLSEHVWQHKPDDNAISRMLILAADHPAAFRTIADELDYWWSLLLPEDHQAAFRKFFDSRSGIVEALIRKRYHRLI